MQAGSAAPAVQQGQDSRREGASTAPATASASARPASSSAASASGLAEIRVQDLPPEARHTLALIQKGGPYPYEKDGTVFGNREGVLPRQRRGYYTEYTVQTPRVRHRGARRIVAGGQAGQYTEFYYTDDHYQSFRRIRMP
ncbi:MAG: ribonuclease domain-containing protein [Lautropia sp.]|nr:ribonuclease domain-containing protein [Lautropia sp.]